MTEPVMYFGIGFHFHRAGLGIDIERKNSRGLHSSHISIFWKRQFCDQSMPSEHYVFQDRLLALKTKGGVGRYPFVGRD
jgi:hypothetical protein